MLLPAAAVPEAIVKGYITRLENQPVQGEASSPVTLPAQALRSDAPDVQEPGNAFPSGYPQRGRSATLTLPEL